MSVQYEDDLFAWAMEQAQMLRARDYRCLDVENLAEELEGMARQQRSELRNRLHTLLLHLLKWQTQPAQRQLSGRGWKLTMREQRRQIVSLLKESGSLRPQVADLILEAWTWACQDAGDDAPAYKFPEQCPWTFDEFMAEDFLPEN